MGTSLHPSEVVQIGEGSNGCGAFKLRVGDRWIKCYECASPERAGMVQSATAALEQAGVPIPRVWAVVGHVVLADWVPGKPLTQVARPTTFSELATYQARIHHADVSTILPSVERFLHLEWLIERVRTASCNYVAGNRIEELCQTIAGLTPKDLKPGVVQPDFIKSNIVKTPQGELAIVDNEFLGIGLGYEFDILNAARVISGGDNPLYQQYVEAYAKAGDCGTLLAHEGFWHICYLTKQVGKHFTEGRLETAKRCLCELESTTRQYIKDRHARADKSQDNSINRRSTTTMRVCLVSHEYPPQTADGGIGTQTWNKAHGLTAAGHTVEVVSSAGAGAKEAARTVNEAGITVHRLAPPGECATGSLPLYDQAAYLIGYSWLVMQHLHQIHSARPFDLINFPEYGADGFAFQLNRSIYNWVPVIVQLHAPLAMLAERMGWPDKGSNFYRTASFMESESIRLADGWMASSANIADFAANVYGVPRDEIDVVHCGIDCNQFRPREVGHKAEPGPIVLFAGTISESKGVTSVFEAVLRLRYKFPDILLRIVGKNNQLSERLLAQAKAAGASRHVEWLPFMKDRASVAAQFQQADVFASPADHENGVANVYVEAMACGCPVIAAHTGGAPEAVSDGETGFLIPPRNIEATATAIERILGDEALRNRMRVAARQRAVAYFAQEKYIQRVLSAYEKTIVRSREKLARLQAAEAS